MARQTRERRINAATRELGITRQEGQRAVKIDAIVPAAKDAMRVARLDNNQTVALKVASYADEDQVEAVAEIVAEREQRAKRPNLADASQHRPGRTRAPAARLDEPIGRRICALDQDHHPE